MEDFINNFTDPTLIQYFCWFFILTTVLLTVVILHSKSQQRSVDTEEVAFCFIMSSMYIVTVPFTLLFIAMGIIMLIGYAIFSVITFVLNKTFRMSFKKGN